MYHLCKQAQNSGNKIRHYSSLNLANDLERAKNNGP
jgi:hypothetical protein